ncbi:hypothetical protein [Polyangium sp. 15x6]|uniref:hypothetical protein n=1 Tax=Polyangium sp. 15x6 TaxID=3042687 RepID=UPI00249CD025|nr:hypothetical protein [Polyangium sp. 15x6]MDI3284573.1 hypothetical protein [Polyangium sp. 15x6]
MRARSSSTCAKWGDLAGEVVEHVREVGHVAGEIRDHAGEVVEHVREVGHVAGEIRDHAGEVVDHVGEVRDHAGGVVDHVGEVDPSREQDPGPRGQGRRPRARVVVATGPPGGW